jgi:dolichol-phosphate mannosyltransferase
VPTYNERENLPQLVGDLLSLPALRILIVDDGSPDGTGTVADGLCRTSGGRVSVLHRTGRRGLGVAYIEGIRFALSHTDADVICQMDADLSHRPVDLASMLRASDNADLVIGSRYVAGGQIVNWPLHRRLLSATANRYIRALCSLPIHDCTSGFRCWRREALAGVPLERIQSEGYAFLVELVHEASRRGCTIVEVPISFVERRHGASKLRAKVLIESAILPWRIALTSPARQTAVDRLERNSDSATAPRHTS